MRPLRPRLAAIADGVPVGSRLADIGTDHAYLPIYLRLTGRCRRVIACDLRPGPLETARRNIRAAGADGIELRLGDGLAPVSPHEVEVIVIAGMGGEEIAAILDRVPWVRREPYTLLLQPMTSPELLRRYLSGAGFSPLEERFVQDDGRPYGILSVRYTGETGGYTGAALYIGKKVVGDPAAIAAYRQKQLARLTAEAAQKRRLPALAEEAAELGRFIAEIQEVSSDAGS